MNVFPNFLNPGLDPGFTNVFTTLLYSFEAIGNEVSHFWYQSVDSGNSRYLLEFFAYVDEF